MRFDVDEMPEISSGWCNVAGYYQAKIVNMEDTESRAGNPMVKIALQVAKGPHKGERMRTQILMPLKRDSEAGKDGDEAAQGRYKMAIRGWHGALMSAGMKAAKADKFITSGKDTGLLEGKECFVEFIPRDEEEGRKFDEVTWKTPEQAEVHMSAPPPAVSESSPMDEFLGGDDDEDDDIPF